MFADAIRCQRMRFQRGVLRGRFEQGIAECRTREFVEITEQLLNSGIDQHFRRTFDCRGLGVDQSGDFIECSAVASSQEHRAHRFIARSHRQQHFQQLQEDVLFARDGDVRAPRFIGAGAEHFPRRVDHSRTARDNQRSVLRVDRACLLNQAVALRRVQVHARHEKQIGNFSVEPHLRRLEFLIPLLQDDPRLGESGIDEDRTNGAHARRSHPQIGKDEREHARAMIERVRDDSGEVVALCQFSQPLPNRRHFA